MAYEKVELVIAGGDGDIYMARTDGKGFMSRSRRVATKECLGASAEWFLKNDKKMIQYGEQQDGTKPTLFFTNDQDKAERILRILQED